MKKYGSNTMAIIEHRTVLRELDAHRLVGDMSTRKNDRLRYLTNNV
jgi:hypothetical protein